MKKIHVYFADGFEEIEAIAPVDVLRRAGCQVTTISVMGNKQVKSTRGLTIVTDKLFEETTHDDFDMLVLPGGGPGSKNLDNHKGLKAKILEADKSGKWLAAICAAPLVFGHLGILKGKKATCYPGTEPELEGAHCTGNPVEKDGHIITAKGAGVALKFSFTLAEILVGKTKADEIKESMMTE